jgi:hypothetical protein
VEENHPQMVLGQAGVGQADHREEDPHQHGGGKTGDGPQGEVPPDAQLLPHLIQKRLFRNTNRILEELKTESAVASQQKGQKSASSCQPEVT